MIIGIYTLAAFLVGICVGYYRRPLLSPLREVTGVRPRWEVETFAASVLHNLEAAVSNPEQRVKIKEIGLKIKVYITEKDNDSKDKETFGVGDDGRDVWIQDGKVWKRRLTRALAHAVRLQLLGDSDNWMKDKQWFAAAYKTLKKN